VVRCMSGILT